MVSKIETNPESVDWPALFDLLKSSFAYMDDRIDPPSSLERMTIDDVVEKARAEDLFLIRDANAPLACLFGTSRKDIYYIGKLAVSHRERGKGLARSLVEAAAARAQTLGHSSLELESRVELVENHAAFVRMGFLRVGETAHLGYNRPTAFTFRRPLSSPQGAGGL